MPRVADKPKDEKESQKDVRQVHVERVYTVIKEPIHQEILPQVRQEDRDKLEQELKSILLHKDDLKERDHHLRNVSEILVKNGVSREHVQQVLLNEQKGVLTLGIYILGAMDHLKEEQHKEELMSKVESGEIGSVEGVNSLLRSQGNEDVISKISASNIILTQRANELFAESEQRNHGESAKTMDKVVILGAQMEQALSAREEQLKKEEEARRKKQQAKRSSQKQGKV